VSAAILVLLSTIASLAAGYAGGALPLIAFHVAFLALIWSLAWMRGFYGYLALVFFLVLGFWTKYLLHVVLGVSLGEPVGAFAGTPAQWDRVLWMAASGGLGVLTASVITAAWRARRRGERALAIRRSDALSAPGRDQPLEQTASTRRRGEPPRWFSSHRPLVWTLACAVVVGIAALNWWLGIWQIGVGNRRILPLHLNAVVMWWFTMAAPMGLAVLVDWERRSVGLTGAVWMAVVVVEAAVSSTTTMSRGVFVMHLLPYYFVFGLDRLKGVSRVRWRTIGQLTFITAAGLALCLASVSWLRLTTYPTVRVAADVPAAAEVAPAPPDPNGLATSPPNEAGPTLVIATGGEPSARQIRTAVVEVAGLFITRWIGLEGVMAVTSFDGTGPALLVKALRESPRRGADSIYQRAAGNPYPLYAGFRFLTLAGIMGVLSYANSAWFVGIGMIVITFVTIAFDAFTNWSLRNEFVSAVVGVGFANIVAQMNFPYLYAVFAIELGTTLLVLWLVAGCWLDGDARPSGAVASHGNQMTSRPRAVATRRSHRGGAE
jgi:hypothetical protein